MDCKPNETNFLNMMRKRAIAVYDKYINKEILQAGEMDSILLAMEVFGYLVYRAGPTQGKNYAQIYREGCEWLANESKAEK